MPEEGNASTTQEGQTQATENKGGSEKTFTQDEVNGIVKRNIERELSKLGDVDDLRRKAEEFDKLTEPQKSEVQKFSDQAAKEKDRADKAEARMKSLEVRVAVTGAASKVGFIDPEDAFRLLDADDIEYDSDGSPKNVDRLLAALAKNKPHLIRGSTNGSFDGGPRGDNAPSGTDINAGIRAAFGRR